MAFAANWKFKLAVQVKVLLMLSTKILDEGHPSFAGDHCFLSSSQDTVHTNYSCQIECDYWSSRLFDQLQHRGCHHGFINTESASRKLGLKSMDEIIFWLLESELRGLCNGWQDNTASNRPSLWATATNMLQLQFAKELFSEGAQLSCCTSQDARTVICACHWVRQRRWICHMRSSMLVNQASSW